MLMPTTPWKGPIGRIRTMGFQGYNCKLEQRDHLLISGVKTKKFYQIRDEVRSNKVCQYRLQQKQYLCCKHCLKDKNPLFHMKSQ